MLKFISHHAESITGIEIYPLVSLCIFFVFFVGLLVYVTRISKAQIRFMESMPLENDNE
jgi:cytochrome c oxidase cbb3-type subunit 4